MSEWRIYHNPRCSKSRAALELLYSHDITPTVVEYLKQPPGIGELQEVIDILGVPASEYVRTGESVFATLGVNLEDKAAVMQALLEHPVLLQRPIVVRGNRAVIGRPPENILKLMD